MFWTKVRTRLIFSNHGLKSVVIGSNIYRALARNNNIFIH